MAGFGDLVQKAVYLGIGLASYAGEKAGDKLGELRTQVQKLADEMVARGEMTAEEGRRMVDDLMQQAQQPPTKSSPESTTTEPRRIEILSDDEEPAGTTPPNSGSASPKVDELRQQVIDLQAELHRLKRD